MSDCTGGPDCPIHDVCFGEPSWATNPRAAIARAEACESELALARLDGNSALVDLAAAVKRAEAAESAIEPAYRRGLEDGRKSSTVMRLRAEAAESGRAAAWARCETLERIHEELRTELTARAEAAQARVVELAGDVVELEGERERWTTEAALGRRNGAATERAAVVAWLNEGNEAWSEGNDWAEIFANDINRGDHLAPAQPTEDSHE